MLDKSYKGISYDAIEGFVVSPFFNDGLQSQNIPHSTAFGLGLPQPPVTTCIIYCPFQ